MPWVSSGLSEGPCSRCPPRKTNTQLLEGTLNTTLNIDSRTKVIRVCLRYLGLEGVKHGLLAKKSFNPPTNQQNKP